MDQLVEELRNSRDGDVLEALAREVASLARHDGAAVELSDSRAGAALVALGWRIKKTSILARVADALNAMLQSGPSDCRARAQLVRDGAPQLLLKLLSNVRF